MGVSVIQKSVDIVNTQTITGAKTMQNLSVTTNALNLAVGQIQFPATQNASAESNTLDDYEEGTFTPTVFGSSTAGVTTYSIQTGQYVKVGQLVYFTITLSISNQTGTGNLRFGGLPFISASGDDFVVSIITSNLTFSNQLTCRVNASSTNMSPITISTGAGSADVAIDTSFTASISGSYRASG